MASPLSIAVCKSCAWKKKKIRHAIRALVAHHEDRLQVVKKSCLDLCGRDPAVIVGRLEVAPAKPKRLRKAVERQL